ncbi:DUF3040 domain-containing protein [Streptomyces sp. NPDC051133]|uniref:DUF3040 domain-containing protein n=1 Tax=Streptomyces sp. NPDC051133 TaxID=3155521 RepID=UPI003427130D
MHDREHPDDISLSPRERLVLLEIEARLRQDRRLSHRMRRMRRVHRVQRMRRVRSDVPLRLSVLLLAVASALVAVMGIRSSDPALLWCFALLWPLTLLQAARLLRRTADRRSRTGGRVTPWL